jgi:hypothetical protein
VTASPAPPRKHPPPGGKGHDIEVLEKNTDTSWAAFQALQQQQQRGYEKTRPATLAETSTAHTEPGGLGVDDVLAEARRNNRVCPKPLIWQRLYEYLPNKVAGLPQVPATRSEWDRMSAMEKRARLRVHIEWAAGQGVLMQVHKALLGLPEERWHHMGD